LALHPGVGSVDVRVKQNGQVKALSCLFYVATNQAGQRVHVIWNEKAVEIFAGDGEHIVTYPRPETTGLYYGPRTPTGTIIKGTGHNPSAGSTGTATRTVSKGGYIGVLANKFYAGYKRRGEQVTITWDTTTVVLTDTDGAVIARYDKHTQQYGWHGPDRQTPSTKS
jgi:putative transposase